MKYQSTIFCLLFFCFSVISCDAGPISDEPGEIYQKYNSKISKCDDVCKIGNWFFTTYSIAYKSNATRASNKAKLKAIEKIYYYLYYPDKYEIYFKNRQPGIFKKALDTKKVKSELVHYDFYKNGEETMIKVIVALKPISPIAQ